MRPKKVPLWEGIYGDWKFHWGLLKDTAAENIRTNKTMTAGNICNLAYIEAETMFEPSEYGYVLKAWELPKTYRYYEGWQWVSIQRIPNDKLYWYHISITVESDVLEHVPVPWMIKSLLIEVDCTDNHLPDISEIANSQAVWKTIAAWVYKLKKEEMPEFLIHDHFLVRRFTNALLEEKPLVDVWKQVEREITYYTDSQIVF